MIVTIDGPGGVGKSTLAKRLAQELGFEVLDTGAMFRAAAYFALQNKLSPEAMDKENSLEGVTITVEQGRCLLNGRDISEAIRMPEITSAASRYAALPRVRAGMKGLQRAFAQGRSIVAEGRDMGSEIFPQAEVKFYLDATSPVRALRRRLQLLEQGVDEPLEKIQAEIEERDLRDRTRSAAPLVVPGGACVIDTDKLSLEQVYALMKETVKKAGQK